MPGFLAVPIAKLAGLGAVTKVAAATATAALTMAVGAGAGVLPVPGGTADSAVVAQGAIDQVVAAVGSASASVPTTTSTGSPAQAAVATSVTSPAGSSSAKASTVVTPPAAVTPAKVAAVSSVATPAIPAPPAMPSCVANLLPAGGTAPDPTKLVSQLPACIQSVVAAHLPLDAIQSAIGSANLPVDVSRCLSSVLASVPGFMGGDLSGLSQLVSACMPSGSVPGTGSMPGGSFSGSRSGR